VFQNAALRAEKLRCRYDVLRTPASALSVTIELLRRERAAGNVTIPHKEAFAAHCAVRSETAQRVGAVNTFWFVDDALHGDNTDVWGATAAIEAVMTGRASPAHCLVFGAGGSAAAVLVALDELGMRDVTIVARHAERARALTERLHLDAEVHTTLPDLAAYDLVINATPIGLSGNEFPFGVDTLHADARVLDLVYRTGGTPLVRAALARGLVAEDGLRMLVEQGVRAFERWFGVTPDRQVVWRSLDDVL
jgi:shikimate dehydrogenase